MVLGALWIFPNYWYRDRRGGAFFWLTEQNQIPGWKFLPKPVGNVAENILTVDWSLNGEFTREDGNEPPVRVFSAKRFRDQPNAVGIFSHTPDRCWRSVGWRRELDQPEFLYSELAGSRLIVERRVFSYAGHKELVYFGAVVGGDPLPYRLDQYADSRETPFETIGAFWSGTFRRWFDPRMWRWIANSFCQRQRLTGPQHYFRVSTPVESSDVGTGDRRITQFLPLWLKHGDFEQERTSRAASAQRPQDIRTAHEPR